MNNMQITLNNDEIAEILMAIQGVKKLHTLGISPLTQSSLLTIDDIIKKLEVETPKVTEF